MRRLKLGLPLVFLLYLQIEAIEIEGVANACPDDSLPCDSGQCVGRGSWCDGQEDCGDESDEAYCIRSLFFNQDPNRCKNTHFLCRNGQCRPRLAKCDNHSDCIDGSDEKNCEPDTFDEYEDYDNTETTSHTQTEATTTETLSQTSAFGNLDFAITTTSIPTVAFTKDIPHYTSTTVYTPRSTHYNGQSNTPSHQSTRSYVYGQNPYQYSTQPTRSYDTRRDPDQHHTQPTRSYDTRRDPYQHHTQPTRSYDTRRDPYQHHTQPYDTRRDPYKYHNQPTRSYDYRRDQHQYQTQPTIPYDSRRDPNQYHNLPTRPSYDSRRDPYHYQTQPSRPVGPRRPVLTMQPHHPYHTTPTANSQNQYVGGTQRIYVDRENYYEGYYDQSGRFVVLHRSQPQQGYRSPPTDDARRNGQDPEIPATTSAVFERHMKAPSRFCIAKNCTRIFDNGNSSYLRKGKEWILSVWNSEGGWGRDTPRALIALSLINNSFVNGTYEHDMMQKYFQIYLGTKLLRGEAEATSLNRLAMSVIALVATCQDPRSFHGNDLTDLIQTRLERLNQRNREDRIRTVPANPVVYLSLCLADRDLKQFQERDLMTRLSADVTPDVYARDALSLSISAFSCHFRRQKSRDLEYQRFMESLLGNATTKLLEKMKDDGSFGNVYGTALAAQALLSLNDTKHWNPEPTLDFLKEHQKSDGSFGDFLATYLVLPVLSGRSLLHLKNTQCTGKFPNSYKNLTPTEIQMSSGPKQHTWYSLYIGHPREDGFSIELIVPQGISFFDMMRVAQLENDLFKFTYEEMNGEIYVYSISNISNDAEQDFQWNLYAKSITELEGIKLNPTERVIGDIREFYPRSDQHVVFWYHPKDFRN